MATLTQQQLQAEYSKIIKEIWGNTISSNRPENITQEVMDVVDTVLTQIKNCSYKMLGADIAFNLIYTATSWKDVIINIAFSITIEPATKSISDWIKVIKGSRQYRSCINIAAVNYRSRLEMALMGI